MIMPDDLNKLSARDRMSYELASKWAALHFNSRGTPEAWGKTQEAERAFFDHLASTPTVAEVNQEASPTVVKFDTAPPSDCPHGSQCLACGYCRGKCSLVAAPAGGEPTPEPMSEAISWSRARRIAHGEGRMGPVLESDVQDAFIAGWKLRATPTQEPAGQEVGEGVTKEWCAKFPGTAAGIINTLAAKLDASDPPEFPRNASPS